MRRLSRALCAPLAVAAALAGACVTPGAHAPSAPELDDTSNGTGYALVNEAWIRVRDTGPATGSLPVVLVHGYGSRLEIWRPIQDALVGERRVVSYDQRGFGLSERPAGAYGPEIHARDLLKLLDELGIERAVLVGHSYGGGVVARAALKAPERVAAVVLVDSFLLEEQMTTTFHWAKAPVVGELLFGAFYREVPGEKYLLAFHDQQRFVTVAALDEQKVLMAKPGSVYAALETVRGMDYREHEGRYGELTAPMLILWGENDRVTPLSQGKRIAGFFDAAELRVIPACGHVPSWERPGAVLAALRPFLSRTDASEADQGGAP